MKSLIALLTLAVVAFAFAGIAPVLAAEEGASAPAAAPAPAPQAPQAAPAPVPAQPEATAVKPAAVITMTEKSKLDPKKVTVKVGDTVEWQNTSNAVHTVTADPKLAKKKGSAKLPRKAEAFHSGDIAPGGTFRYMFTVPGTYTYFSVPDEKGGMTGQVTVKEVKSKASKTTKRKATAEEKAAKRETKELRKAEKKGTDQ